MKIRNTSLVSVLLGGTFFACSIVNAPDDLIPPGDGDGDLGGGPGDGDGSGGGTGDGDGDGSGGAPLEPPTQGLLVVAGLGETESDRLLVAIDPDTGEKKGELATPAVAVAYDGAPDRYFWFVFTATDLPDEALYPTRLVDLQVLRFDDEMGEFIQVANATALPPPRPDTLVVLNDRLAYLSYEVIEGTPTEAYTVLDTSDVTSIVTIATETAGDSEHFVGMVGLRGSAVDGSALGGTLDLMIADTCNGTVLEAGTTCSLTAQPLRVAANVTDGVAVGIGQFVGAPRFASGVDERLVHAALHRPAPVENVVLSSFDPEDPGTPDDVTTTSSAQDLAGLSVLECETASLFTERSTMLFRGLNFTTGVGQQVTLDYEGAQVYPDLFNNGVFLLNRNAIFGMDDDASVAVTAYDVVGSGVNVSLSPRTDFVPPTYVVPLSGATRSPVDTSCPE